MRWIRLLAVIVACVSFVGCQHMSGCSSCRRTAAVKSGGCKSCERYQAADLQPPAETAAQRY